MEIRLRGAERLLRCGSRPYTRLILCFKFVVAVEGEAVPPVGDDFVWFLLEGITYDVCRNKRYAQFGRLVGARMRAPALYRSHEL